MDDQQYIVRGASAPADPSLGTRSLGELFLKVLRQAPDSVTLVNGATGEKYTNGEILERAIQLADYLTAHNVRRGDLVAIVAENRFEYPITLIALFLVGATAALFNPHYTARELTHALNTARPKLVFVSSMAREQLLQAGRSITQINLRLISYDAVARATTFADCLRRASSKRPPVPEPVELATETAVLVMSSGTTGLPKGVLITHGNIVSCMANLHAAVAAGIELRCTVEVLPWFHVAGGMALLSFLGANITTVFLARFEPRTYLSCVATFRPNFLNVVPPIAVFLAKHPLVDEFDLSSVQTITCGAAPLSKEVEDLIYARLKTPGLRVRQGYGLSETTQAITFYDGVALKRGSIGKVRAGQQAKVIDLDTGRALGPHQHGELCFKGSLIMKGYIGQDATGLDSDGWLHTGDIGYYDADGDFFIVDRLKELIKYNGFQVPPAELEALLLSHPAVKDAAVIGVPDERAGELPMAFVVRADEAPQVSEGVRGLLAFVDARVSNEKRLRGGIRFVGEIPKTTSGKILRRTLRELAAKPSKL